MRSVEVTLNWREGLSLRGAAMLVLLARSYRCNIWVQSGRQLVRTTEIVPLMMLDSRPGRTLKVTAEGEDEDSALRTIHKFLSSPEPTIDALRYRIRHGDDLIGDPENDSFSGDEHRTRGA